MELKRNVTTNYVGLSIRPTAMGNRGILCTPRILGLTIIAELRSVDFVARSEIIKEMNKL